MALRTDYKNDELNTAVNTERQFEEVTNPNGTKSYRDVTDYSQVGDDFGADLVNSQNAEINAKAPLDSPAFTGTPTAPTQSQSTSDDTIATTAYVKSTFSNIIDPNLRTSGKAADAQVTGNRIASVQASIPAIDTTLTTNGAAADAKAVGDALANVVAGGSIRTVENMEQLLTTTEDTVLVLHNDSTYGDGGACLFEATDGVDTYGYQRTSDSKYMIPVTDQNVIVKADPPIDALMDVIKTWVGNENVKHMPVGNTDQGSLFGTTIRQVDGKWTMDCSAFTSAVLMGITYNNSRYVLGNNANNIELEYFPGAQFPPSRWVGEGRTKGGLGATETAMWLAEHKRLYSFDEDPKIALSQLQFGDIIFGSNFSSSFYNHTYKNIEHLAIVLGTIPSQGLLIVAESIDLTYEATHYEQIGAHINVSAIKDDNTGKTNRYFQVWGRPDYSHIGKKKDALVPKTANSYTYNCFFLNASLVCRGSSDSSTIPAGKLMSGRYLASTPDFYPAIPGSVVSYTGASQCDRGVYLCRVHEYDDEKKLIKSSTIAYATNGSPRTAPATIGSTTKYLRFTFGLQSNTMSDTSIGIWMSNLDDCEITVTLPTT